MVEALKRFAAMLFLMAATFLIIWAFLHFILQEEFALVTAVVTTVFGFGYLLVWQIMIPTFVRSRKFSEETPERRPYERRAARRAHRRQN